MNLDETEFMSFKQDEAIISLNGKPLKLVDQFIYLSSNITSTVSDVNIHIGKHGLQLKGYQSYENLIHDKIKLEFLQADDMSMLLYDYTIDISTKWWEKKLLAVFNKS